MREAAGADRLRRLGFVGLAVQATIALTRRRSDLGRIGPGEAAAEGQEKLLRKNTCGTQTTTKQTTHKAQVPIPHPQA